MAFLLFVLLVISCNTYAFECDYDKTTTIYLNDSWGFPLASAQACNFQFEFSPDKYARMYLRADMMEYDFLDIRYVDAPLGQRPQDLYGSQLENSSYITNLSYVSPFYVSVRPFPTLQMQLEIQIQLYPNIVSKNGQQSLTAGLNKPTQVLYFEDIQEGILYNFHAESNVSHILPVYPELWYTGKASPAELWNIWLYINQTYYCSMFDWGTSSYKSPLTGDFSIYVMQKLAPLAGAIVFSDYANYDDQHTSPTLYVPVIYPDETYMYPIHYDSLTLLGAKDGSTPFDVRMADDSMSYLAGGRVRDPQNATVLKTSLLPFHVTGHLNTFYVGSGGWLKITVSD